MLLQSMLLIVTMIALGGSLLTASLVNARAAFHHSVSNIADQATLDATNQFLDWTRANAKSKGVEKLSAWAVLRQRGILTSACGDQQQHAKPQCPFSERLEWETTGYTTTADVTGAPISGVTARSDAPALSIAQDEQRLSATLTVTITNAKGDVTYAKRSREITARIFHSFPYASITASRDVNAEIADTKSSEGDTGGYSSRMLQPTQLRSRDEPSKLTDTVITTTVHCRNTQDHRLSNANDDGNNVLFASLRRYGSLAWAFEAPCSPSTRIDPSTIPSDYVPPKDGNYVSGNAEDALWDKGDDDKSPFPR